MNAILKDYINKVTIRGKNPFNEGKTNQTILISVELNHLCQPLNTLGGHLGSVVPVKG